MVNLARTHSTMNDEGRLLFYFYLICLLHWGKQMIMSPCREFCFLFDIQINSLHMSFIFATAGMVDFKKHIVTPLSYIMPFTAG